MPRVRIKICGIASATAARAAVAAGVDAIGLVFYRDSPRAVTLATACAIAGDVAPFVARVALFLDADAAEVHAVCAELRPDLIQFHGRETPEFCSAFGIGYIKTVPMGQADIDVAAYADAYRDARALLLDGNRAGQAGGRGQAFDWHAGAGAGAGGRPIVLAGGLDAGNVGEAIRLFAPYAVDVSSAVESAPGVKDAARMNNFVKAVHTAG